MVAYPDAKVVLTVRDPVKWYNSVRNTIYQVWQAARNDTAVILFTKMTGLYGKIDMAANLAKGDSSLAEGDYLQLSLEISTFKFQIRQPWLADLHRAITEGEAESVKFFNEWVAEVKNTVPADRLLVFEVKEGWGPLCNFLNLPVPEVPFPNTNDTASMNRKINSVKNLSKVVIFGLPVAIAVALGILIYREVM